MRMLLITLTVISAALVVKAQTFLNDYNWVSQAGYHYGVQSPRQNFREYLNIDHGTADYTLNSEEAPWAGNYYPMASDGIATRWQRHFGSELSEETSADHTRGSETRLNRARVLEMDAATLNQLSPAEKMDIFLGDYSFKITRRELRSRGTLRRPTPQSWEGFCNGVRAAGLLAPEPVNSIKVQNPDGVEIEFAAADLKALIGASYFYVEKYNQIGNPTRRGEAKNLPNAAVFDMALRQMIGEAKKGFVIDVNSTSEIWNETIVGYTRSMQEERDLTESEASKHPTAQMAREYRLVLRTLGEIGISRSNRETREGVASGRYTTSKVAYYTVFMKNNGQIVDGEWTGGEIPDFAWFPGGRGADASFASSGGNRHLPYNQVIRLVRQAAAE